jgi:hypothetical protein
LLFCHGINQQTDSDLLFNNHDLYTPASLALYAANYELNKVNIGFVGILENGISYVPLGT